MRDPPSATSLSTFLCKHQKNLKKKKKKKKKSNKKREQKIQKYKNI